MFKTLITISIGTLLSLPVLANGLGEDRSWKFRDPITKQLQLNGELARIKLDEGGFKQVFNIAADGASSVYVGNNTWIDKQNNLTNIANQSAVNVEGDSNVIEVGQDLSESSQGNEFTTVTTPTPPPELLFNEGG